MTELQEISLLPNAVPADNANQMTTSFSARVTFVLAASVAAVSATSVLAEMPQSQPASSPASNPTTRSLEAVKASVKAASTTQSATQSTTKPTTRRALVDRDGKAIPSPRDLIAKMRDEKAKEEAKPQVALIDVSAGFPERGAAPAALSLLGGGGGGETFRELIERFQAARKDKQVKAVLVTMNQGTGLNMAQIQELRAEFDALRKADKRVFAYADTYDTSSYLLASAASDVCMLEAGEIFMPGIGIESMFYKGTLDKVGVKADYVQIGEYKGAEEPYTRDGPSEELTAEMERLTKNLMDEVVNGISAGRGISAAQTRKLMDGVLVMSKAAQEADLVDHLIDADGIRELLKDELGVENADDLALKVNFGRPDAPEVDFSNPFALLGAMAKQPVESNLPKVAVIYAQGVIVDGEDDGGGLPLIGGGDQSVASEPMRRALRLAMRDDNVKAVVIRIDSPGGSALASEVMWQSVRRLAADKPVVVSIGHMAASGGYYLASASDCIYADPSAIVGSIGVVGGKMVLGGLYEKVGLTTATFTQGRNADIYSSTTPWTESQRRMIRGWMKNTYDQFTDRIMVTRKGKIDDIDEVARGRIFTAREAKRLGMVDQLGSLDDAIGEAAKRAKLDEGKYDLKALPPPPTLQELLGRRGTIGLVAPNVSAEKSVLLSLLPADVRQSLGQTIRMGKLMERRPVVLMSPFVISVK